MVFRLLRALIRFLLAVFYRRIEVVGAERIPAQGPLILAANHHNSVVDAMLLIAVAPRPLRTLAVAQLFSNPLIGPFLRLAGALPVHRRQEAGDNPNKNDALFAATHKALRNGEAILIFPEGRTQPEPVLLELRTGAARMLLEAQNETVQPILLLPVGLLFERPGIFRAGRALVLVGEPVATAALPANEPARELTDRLAASLRELILEAPDRETLRLVSLVESLDPVPPPDSLARVNRLKELLAGYRWLASHCPGPLAAFGANLAAYATATEEAGVSFGRLPRSYSASGVLAFAFRETLVLLAGLPPALGGLLLHAVPYAVTGWVVDLIPHTAEEDATDKISAGLVFYPLAWSAEAWLAYRWGGRLGLLAFLLMLLPGGFFALSWRERMQRFGLEARAFLRVLRNPDLPRQVLARRLELSANLKALASLLPPA